MSILVSEIKKDRDNTVRSRRIVVAFPFVGDEVGGSHISAINLISRLDATKIQPLIVLHHQDGVLARYLDEKSIPYVAAPSSTFLSPSHRSRSKGRLAMSLAYLTAVPRLIGFLRKHKVAIVHTNDGQMHATWALPARLAGSKLLWHHRADPEARGVNTLAPLLASHIITVSKFAKPNRPVVSVEGKVTVLHSPFEHPASIPDREESRLALIRELGLSDKARFVGYFGVLIDRKRPVKFVEVVAQYNKRYPEADLHGLLFGVLEQGGPRFDEQVIQKAKELGVSDKIHLMGFRSPVAPFMCAVDALLVTAVNEPFGRTLIEAMLLGTPVIATNHGGNPEAITDGVNGFLVRPEDPEAFVEPLHRLLADKADWQAISETARRQALTAYGADMHVEGITAIYERLTAPAGGEKTPAHG